MSLKVFEFRRHSIKDGPTGREIGPNGYALARAVGRAQLRGRAFDRYFVSVFWRTQQTLAAFAEGAGDFALKLGPELLPIYLDWPELRQLWHVCRQAELRGEDLMRAALLHDEALTRRAATEAGRLFGQWSGAFPDGAKVLIVGHSPYLEFIPFGLLGAQLSSLKECQGYRLLVDGDDFGLDVHSGNLNPSSIRSYLFP